MCEKLIWKRSMFIVPLIWMISAQYSVITKGSSRAFSCSLFCFLWVVNFAFSEYKHHSYIHFFSMPSFLYFSLSLCVCLSLSLSLSIYLGLTLSCLTYSLSTQITNLLMKLAAELSICPANIILSEKANKTLFYSPLYLFQQHSSHHIVNIEQKDLTVCAHGW